MRTRSDDRSIGNAGSRPAPDRYIDDERRQLRLTIVISLLIGAVVVWETSDLDPLDAALLAAPTVGYCARLVSSHVWRWLMFPVALVPAALLNLPELRTEGILFAPVAAVTYLALFEPRRWIPLVCGIISVGAPLSAVVLSGEDDWGWPFWMIGTFLGYVIGEIGHRYRERLVELRAARQVIADQAVVDERRRIARDVHDLVGHSLSVVMLQVTAARELVRTNPAEAEAALDDAARVGRESMGDIRRSIGLLRDGDADDTRPAPTLVDLADLIAAYRAAGVTIIDRVEGDPTSLDQPRSNAAYRIVQEALTNASRHASVREVELELTTTDATCRITISNPVIDGPIGTAGLGVVGMRERAQSVGGTLRAEQTGDRWLVDATLPGGDR